MTSKTEHEIGVGGGYVDPEIGGGVGRVAGPGSRRSDGGALCAHPGFAVHPRPV